MDLDTFWSCSLAVFITTVGLIAYIAPNLVQTMIDDAQLRPSYSD